MSIIFNLPEVQQAYILTEWLHITDLQILDDAVLGDRKNLKDYRALLRLPTFVFPVFPSDEYRVDFIGWTIDRGLKFKIIKMWSYTFEDVFVRENFFTVSGPVVTTIEVCMHSDYEYNDYRGFNLGNQLSCIIKEIGALCPRLTEFSACCNDTEGHSLPLCPDDRWDCIALMLQACTALQKLTLHRAGGLNKKVMSAICNAPNLIELDIANSHCVPGAELTKSVNPKVKTLHCNNVELEDKYMTGETFIPLYTLFPGLHTVSLSGLSSEGLLALSTACPLLTSVTLEVAETVADSEVLQFAQALPHLQVLQLSGFECESCSPLAVVLLVEQCPSLTYLNLCSSTTHKYDASNHIVSQSTDGTGRMAHLSSCLQELFVESLSEHTLCTIIALCPLLHTLGICHGEAHTSDTIDETFSIRTVYTPHTRPAELALHHINHTSIRTLYLQHYTHLQDAHLLPLCSLDQLHVSHTSAYFTHEAITKLSIRCPGLQVLCVKACDCVDYTFILPLLQQCPSLHTLKYDVRDSTETNSTNGNVSDSNSPVNIMLTQMVRKFYRNIRCFDVCC